MRVKKLHSLLQFRIADNDKARLAEIAEELGLDQAVLARLSLREGMSRIAEKFPQAERVEEP